MSEWKTVSIKQELIKEIEKTIEMGRSRSVSEFVSEAIRLRLEGFMRVETASAGKPHEIVVVKDETVKEVPQKDEGQVHILEQTTSQVTQS